MRIGIIGSGNMGSGFAKALAGKHDVTVGSRDPDKAKRVADATGVAGGSYRDAISNADVVVLAVPWPAVPETLGELGDLSGTVVIDLTNPYTAEGLKPLEGTSTAEEIQRQLPGARVVKGWNHVFASNLTRPDVRGEAASVFIAGDDAEAKDVVATIARDMGFEAVDVGNLEAVRGLERLLVAMGMLHLGPDRPLRVLQR